MSILIKILKWTLIILFFPLSLIFVAYHRQKIENRKYWEEKNSE
jgi:preprotein translocase subunit SecG